MTDTRSSLSLRLADETETDRLGEELALVVKPGDCLALWGDLGAGKSTLSRALLRAMADDDYLEVPSPTFTLVQNYDLRLAVAHFDLYRLTDPEELEEIGFSDALDSGVCLVEWPDKAGTALPGSRIDIAFGFEPGGGRQITITAPALKIARIERVFLIRRFLDAHGYAGARRRHLTGDASTRAYEYIYPADAGTRRILMDAPRQPDGPPIRNGKPYSQIAHLAEDVYPFVAIDTALRDRGFAAPEIYESDCEAGLLLIEDLGQETVLDEDGKPIAERYRASVECLAALHATRFDRDIPLPTGGMHHVPDYDRTVMKMEAELLIDWHLPWKRNGAPASDEERAEYGAIWDRLIDQLADTEKNLVLRDFHSPNIIWRGAELGVQRIGLIDFQDAMIGPSAYDLVSIVQDARVTVERPLVDQLMADYLSLRRAEPDFDEQSFLKAWAIMSAQRACKLNGLWVRLMKRDHKPGYMKHMPRTLWHLSVAFEHEALAPLRDWCARVGIGPTESLAQA
ncbi:MULTISPECIES: tRNA (adenosine(37)-N6)-threonylcarbamoyltransferase complex ATPase subunit type 1 TsaE [Alphaproteobacteria]|uniref:tRNA threonylcarbamoyladenosine biosynthesis protein TsaE n=2 Tax=Alphaproteobacteria TaxID=28211 RepID=A0A512HMB2_9HYPH|nr:MULTISPECIES: tRNA (adenosine(37)-N6)-threonylcarbamoyltransferase complex ATPase subunit type 1 TsaE [Alphaproteobacteria]GEO86569.1 bifunctional tRNA (adenosine(37)-N6)-threonylcarbamoyltransferase complex ATPase subunit type 1 TsaE/phosphotransferase [Ciceribacter naphthalenivorans]GLR20859.1 bifunctional tRNA (adenosine(37)-N6)-threonylcarbamoyltransferase complex ATPase subunit type 1 TsaE/phosphotransferase [Ciceribacter naphthalenivorans]GLT03715.1 bifunctional tRNA (adenosine(37)-N6)-